MTAQLNRFYTFEFFKKARKKLNEDGIFSLRIPSSENYISYDLQNFLSSLHRTLLEVFPNVQVVPGSTNIFLASDSFITLDPKELSIRIESLNLDNTFVSPFMIEARLSPERKEFLSRLNAIHGIKIPEDAIHRYPSIFLSFLKDTTAMQKLQDVFSWYFQEIKDYKDNLEKGDADGEG